MAPATGNVDVVTFEVLRHRLWEINDEMALLMGCISGAPSVYESGDFNTAIPTPEGRGLYAGVYVIRQASALDIVVQKVIEVFGDDIHDGDAFMTNDPWYGALHAMDTAVVVPIFADGELVAWTGVAVQEQILDYVRRSIRQRIADLPDGTWYANALLDHSGLENDMYRLKLALTKRGDRLEFDFTGTEEQVPGSVNCTYSGLIGGILQVLFPLLCFDLPWSHGAVMDCIDIISEEGTINNATFPAGTSMATVNACQSTGNLIWEAMARMYGCGGDELREEVIGLGYGGVNMAVIAGRRNDNSTFVNMFTDSVGGGGGRSFGDGIDTCGNFIAPAYAIPNIERTESLHPLMCVYRREREETAGAGIYRGGTGIEYMFIPYGTDHPMEAVYFSTGCGHMETKGVAGGLPGSIQRNVVARDIDIQGLFAAGTIPTALADLSPGETDIVAAKDVRWLNPNDAWICFCTGGGGYGDPLDREPSRVAADVRRCLCTQDEARRLYGVIVDAEHLVDAPATETERQARRHMRLETGRRPATQLPANVDFSGEELFRVGSILSVRTAEGGPVLGCRECSHGFGPAGDDPRQYAVIVETPIADLHSLNAHADSDDMVLHQYCCAGCGTLFSTDLHRRGEDPLRPEMHLALNAAE